jgi:hypothetical protein
MTTERRRARPAQAARRIVGGASVAAVLGLVAAWSAPAEPAIATRAAPASLRVVIADPAIDRDVAIAAAVDAAARGIDRVTVPVAGTAPAAPANTGTTSHGTHSTTSAS